MYKKGCQCCGCDSIQFEKVKGHERCLDCSWIDDKSLKSDKEKSKINGYSIEEYNKLIKKYPIIRPINNNYYEVSTIHPNDIPLAYHHDFHGNQGCWGLVDKNFKVIISPKYLFSLAPFNDFFVACIGTGWVKSKQWDKDQRYEYNKGKYWTKEEKWGIIDINEKQIIPLIYDEISCINISLKNNIRKGSIFVIYRHQYKPYTIQEVSLVDINGNEIIPFIYNDVGYYIVDNQIDVYKDGTKYYSEMCGVYDLKLKKEIIKPNTNYKIIDIIKRNLFLVSQDSQMGFNGTLIDENEKVIGEKNYWKFVDYSPRKKNRKYSGKSISGDTIEFNIVDGKIVDIINSSLYL